MHWISLIGFFIIVNICQTQPSTFKNFETENTNKGGTFQVVPGGNNADVSGSKNSAAGSGHVSNNNVPSESSMKYDKNGRNTFQFMASSGNNNHCYIVLPFIITALMAIVHF